MSTVRDLIRDGRCNTARCQPDAYMDDIIDMMAQLHESAITVVDKTGQIAGILTDFDVMRAINCEGTSGHSICGAHVKDWMTPHVIACAETTPLQIAEQMMSANNIHHLVVKDDEQLVGIISISKILNRIHIEDFEELSGLRATLSTQATQVAA